METTAAPFIVSNTSTTTSPTPTTDTSPTPTTDTSPTPTTNTSPTADASSSTSSPFERITRNLHEVIGRDVLAKIVASRDLKVYWGTAPTGRIHLGYFMAMLKIADLAQAGCEVTILFADLHALLDSQKTPEKKLQARTQYYELVITAMLRILGFATNLWSIRFVHGTDFQLTREYTMDVYRLNMLATVSDSQHAGVCEATLDFELSSKLLVPKW